MLWMLGIEVVSAGNFELRDEPHISSTACSLEWELRVHISRVQWVPAQLLALPVQAALLGEPQQICIAWATAPQGDIPPYLDIARGLEFGKA